MSTGSNWESPLKTIRDRLLRPAFDRDRCLSEIIRKQLKNSSNGK